MKINVYRCVTNSFDSLNIFTSNSKEKKRNDAQIEQLVKKSQSHLHNA